MAAENIRRLELYSELSAEFNRVVFLMTTAVQSSLSREHISAWLRGLLTIAWADGHFDDEEREMIASLTQDELADNSDLNVLEPIAPAELAAIFGANTNLSENFLRTAVMVAIADGIYSPPEDAVLRDFCQALNLQDKILNSLRETLQTTPTLSSDAMPIDSTMPGLSRDMPIARLRPVQDWLDQLEIHDPRVARFLCKMIPPQCPFERDVTLFGRKIVHIPPLCKLNPLYEQLVGLRFRALSFLAEDCGEDVTPYC